ncbi:CidA/LrgA family protein [Thaumasiovibrio subtropicus]|uniref:CidA/LrgA family protein n=1 Tax=Thaumasiovibrio subtropicus TaxID=1891207 RepID=UPI000B35E911|nr:CidA/LrgA family protein [Thaumasiovibrio subtropicus]
MKLLRAFLIIFAFTYLGNFLADWLALPFPGSIVGMLSLFAAMVVKMIPSEWVRPGSDLIMKHMALLFVPISVGLMVQGDIIREHGLTLIVSNLLSSLVVLILIGWLCERGVR